MNLAGNKCNQWPVRLYFPEVRGNCLFYCIIDCFHYSRLTTNEILDELKLFEARGSDISDLDEDEEGPYSEVAFDPPKENEFAVSDEDSDKSDGETTGKVEHLPRRILRSTAELSSKHEEAQEVPDKCYSKKRAPTSNLSWPTSSVA